MILSTIAGSGSQRVTVIKLLALAAVRARRGAGNAGATAVRGWTSHKHTRRACSCCAAAAPVVASTTVTISPRHGRLALHLYKRPLLLGGVHGWFRR